MSSTYRAQAKRARHTVAAAPRQPMPASSSMPPDPSRKDVAASGQEGSGYADSSSSSNDGWAHEGEINGGGAGPGNGAEPVEPTAAEIDGGADERNLLVRFQQGDPEAFEILWARYNGPIFNFIYRMVGSNADAEELAQETWVRVLRAVDRYEPRAKVLTWVLQIARNLCLDHFKKMALRQHQSLQIETGDGEGGSTLGDLLPDHDAVAPIDPLLASESSERLQAAIARLSDKKRESLVLRIYHELPYDEISRIVEAPAGTVKYRVHEAIGELRTMLQKSANEEG